MIEAEKQKEKGQSEQGERDARRRRRDFGSVRVSERDRRLLLLIGEQYAITVPQLAVLIGRGERTARWLRDRWQTAGWVESRQLAIGAPSFVWLTRQGTQVAQSPFRTWTANPGLAVHVEAVNEVRLLLEEQLVLGDWLCERTLAQAWPRRRSERRPHLPDAVLATGQGRIAVEVELTLKSRSRLHAILAELGRRHEQVWYFAAAPLFATLEQLAADAPYRNIRVHHYPPRPGELSTCA